MGSFDLQNFLLGSNGASPGQYATPYANQGQMQGYIQQGMQQAAPQLDPTQQAQFRAMQLQQAQQLAGIASGQQQGAGELAVQRQIANAQAAQHAQAMMARGGANAALAYRGAANNQAQLGLQGAGQSQQAALTDQMNAQQALTGALNNGRGQDIGIAGQNAQLQAGQNQLQLGYTGALGTMDANQLAAQAGMYGSSQQNKGLLGSLLSAGGQAMTMGGTSGAAAGAAGPAAAASDERLKHDIADAGDDIDAMLDALHAKTYRYKDEKKFGAGPRAGIMAGDLAKSRAGKALVVDLPNAPGMKGFDVVKGLSAALASAARLNERLRKVGGALMGMITSPTGETFYMPDPPVGAPAPVTPVGDLPVPGQPMPLPGEPAPVAPWMPPPPVMAAAQNGFAPIAQQNTPDVAMPPVQAQPVTPAPKPLTNAQMQDQAAAGEIAVNRDEQTNAIAQGENTAKQAEEAATLKAQQVADEQKAQREAAAAAEARNVAIQKEHDSLNADIVAQSKRQVDPNRMYNSMTTGQHVQAGIGILLAGIGQGLNGDHGANPAMKLITDAIDRDVDAQKTNIEQGNKTLEQKRGQLADTERIASRFDDQTEKDRASKRLIAADQLEAAAMKYASPQARLVAQQQANQLRSQAYQISGALADKRITQQQKDAETAVARAHVGLGYANLALEQKKFDAGENDKARADALKLLEAGMRGQGKTPEEIKDFQEHAMFDPATGAPILTSDGEKLLAHADQVEVAARAAPDQASRDALNSQAATLRQTAQTQYAAKSDNAKTLKPKLGAAQRLTDNLSTALEELDKDPSSFDAKSWQKIQSAVDQAKQADPQFFGANATARSMSVMDKAFGPNADAMVTRWAREGKLKTALETMRDSIQADTDSVLRSEGILGPKSTWTLNTHRGVAVPTIGETTSTEAAAAEEPGIVERVTGVRPLHPFTPPESRGPAVAENAAGFGPTGLSATDTAKVTTMTDRFSKAPDSEQSKILTQLTAYALSDREGISNGTLGLLRGNNPELFAKILPLLPPEKQAAYAPLPAQGWQPNIKGP